MVNFPIEIITNILCRLDVNTLVEYKLVCKEWLNLIRSNYFADLVTHNNSLSSTITNRTLIVSDKNSNLYSVNLDSSPDTPARRLRVNTTNLLKNRKIKFIGSCKGILCLRDTTQYHNSIIFLNPITHQCKIIDVSGIESGFSRYGFGYNSYERDHKIVLLSGTGCDSGCTWKTSVYSLRKNTWKVVPSDGFPRRGVYGSNFDKGVLVGTNLVHWVASLFHWNAPCISKDNYPLIPLVPIVSCFNLCDDKWSDVPLPSISKIDQRRGIVVGVLDGCLSLLIRYYHIEDGCDLWIMKEYGVVDSWVKLLDFSYEGVTRPFFEEILVAHKNSNDRPMRYWYNPRTKTERKAAFDGIPTYFDHLMFSEGLATIPGGVQIGEKDN